MMAIYAMLDFDRIIGFQWDAGNARKSKNKHDVSQSEAEQVFVDTALLLLADPRHSLGEPRFHAFGRTVAGRRLHISFTLRVEGTMIRVISARPMSRKERKHYDRQT